MRGAYAVFFTLAAHPRASTRSDGCLGSVGVACAHDGAPVAHTARLILSLSPSPPSPFSPPLLQLLLSLRSRHAPLLSFSPFSPLSAPRRIPRLLSPHLSSPRFLRPSSFLLALPRPPSFPLQLDPSPPPPPWAHFACPYCCSLHLSPALSPHSFANVSHLTFRFLGWVAYTHKLLHWLRGFVVAVFYAVARAPQSAFIHKYFRFFTRYGFAVFSYPHPLPVRGFFFGIGRV